MLKYSNRGISTLLIIGIIAIAVILIGGGVLAYMYFKTPNPINSNPEIASWNSYSDSKYGFEIKHPIDYIVSQTFAGDGISVVGWSIGKENLNNKFAWGWLIPGGVAIDSNQPFQNMVEQYALASCAADGPNASVSCDKTTQSTSFLNQNGVKIYEIYLNQITQTYNPASKTNTTIGPFFAIEFPIKIGSSRGIYFENRSIASTDDKNLLKELILTFKFKTPNNSTTEWKKYTNTQYGFEIQYPDSMSVQNSTNGVSLLSADNQRKVDIKVESIEPGQDCHKTAWAADIPNITIDNTTFVGVGSGLKDEPYYGVVYCAIRNGLDYMITSHLFHVSGGPNNLPENDAALNQIISTFKFTTTQTRCIPEGGEYAAPTSKYDFCCQGLVKHATTQSGTVGICVKPISLKINNIDYNFYLADDSVEVFDKDGIILQSIKIGKDEMDAAKFDAKNYGHQIVTANDDVNYDGYKDLAIEIGNGYGGVNFFYNFYYFNPTTKKFIEVPELKNVCNPNFKYEQKEILSSCKDGPGYSDAIYQWGAPGYMLINIPKIYRVDPTSASVGNQASIYRNNFARI